MTKVKILVTLEDGEVQAITASADVEVTILDRNDRSLISFSPDCGKELYDEVMREVLKSLKKEKASED